MHNAPEERRTDEIKPALTPEQWRTGLPMERHSKERHSIAARCLEGQPFGFTWEDVDALQRVIDDYDPTNFPQPSSGVPRRVLVLLRARIAALLPPRSA